MTPLYGREVCNDTIYLKNDILDVAGKRVSSYASASVNTSMSAATSLPSLAKAFT